jgi:hypothetical protein
MDNAMTEQTPEELRAENLRIARTWKAEIKLYEREFQSWESRAKKVVERYLDKRTINENGVDTLQQSRFNILWSNIQTMLPAAYSKQPNPQVSRRYRDKDPVGRVASQIIERCLDFEQSEYRDLDTAIKGSLTDRLLPGRGVAWIRYEPRFVQMQPTTGQISEDVPEYDEVLESECSPIDYVHWRDFGHCSARSWEEVRAVWRAVYLKKDQLKERFGPFAEQLGYSVDEIPLDTRPEHIEDKGTAGNELDDYKMATIYEVWDKTTKRVIWINNNIAVPLDIRDDPLEVDGFFPCPKPLYATTGTDGLIPVPDFCFYQDQARELDTITQRIGLLEDAVKVVGLYDAANDSVKRVLNEGINNTMIPVDNWAIFAEKGGMKGVVDWMPLDMVILALEKLYQAREQTKQVIYEVTGIADIVRGSTNAGETATAQQIKANFAGLRIRTLQNDVARFARDLIRLRAEVICNLYSDKTIIEMADVKSFPPEDQQFIPQALQLLRNDVARDFRIDIETDSMVELDEAEEKQSATELVTAIGAILDKAGPIVQMAPQLGFPIGQTLMMVMRKFKAGRQVEQAWEDALDQMRQQAMQPKPPPQPDPRLQVEQLKAQTAMTVEPIKAQAEVIKAQAGVQQAQLDMQKTAMQPVMPAPEMTQ